MFGILFLSLKRSLKRNLVNLIFPRGRVPGGGGGGAPKKKKAIRL